MLCVGWVAQSVYRLWAGRSEIESRWGWDFPPVKTGPGANPASCKMGTGSFAGVECGQGMLLTIHPLLVPWSWKSRAIPIPLPTLWPHQACNRITLHFYLLWSYAVYSSTSYTIVVNFHCTTKYQKEPLTDFSPDWTVWGAVLRRISSTSSTCNCSAGITGAQTVNLAEGRQIRVTTKHVSNKKQWSFCKKSASNVLFSTVNIQHKFLFIPRDQQTTILSSFL